MSAEDEASWARHFAEVAEGVEELRADELGDSILVEESDGYTLPEVGQESTQGPCEGE